MHTETLDPEHQRVCNLPSLLLFPYAITNIFIQTGDFKEYGLFFLSSHLIRITKTVQTDTAHPSTRAMNFGEFRDGKAQQPIPSSLVPHERELCHFAELCNKTCSRILKLMALGLEVSLLSPLGFQFLLSIHRNFEQSTQSVTNINIYSIIDPRSHQTSSLPAMTPLRVQLALSSVCSTTLPFSLLHLQPTSTTWTFAPGRILIMVVSLSYSRDPVSRVWKSSLRKELGLLCLFSLVKLRSQLQVRHLYPLYLRY